MWVIINQNRYVAAPNCGEIQRHNGLPSSYTRKAECARAFATEAEALREACADEHVRRLVY